ncbi:hypothetical protein CNR22_22970 [Sphingobacteriaceae bacterium]|nr:hypothetical protein CNR22_22970 [Sphingobacteriaceae bacterium]
MNPTLKITRINMREFQVNESKIYLNEDDIICNEAYGTPSMETAQAIKDANLTLACLNGKPSSVLVDLTHAGKPSLEARKILKKFIECTEVGRLAFIGMHPVAKVLATFYIGISQKKEIALFKTKTEALLWLKEK